MSYFAGRITANMINLCKHRITTFSYIFWLHIMMQLLERPQYLEKFDVNILAYLQTYVTPGGTGGHGVMYELKMQYEYTLIFL